MELNVRATVFETWLASAGRGDSFVYHRGELGRDKAQDARLADLAEKMLHLSNGRFDVVSVCGHIRSEIIGNRQVELITRRDRGEIIYCARKL